MSKVKPELLGVKPGDKLIQHDSNYGQSSRVVTVDRVTASQIIVGNERFNLSNGRRRGDTGYHHSWLIRGTAEELDAIADESRRCALLTKLNELLYRKMWSDFTAKQLNNAVGALDR